MDDAMIEIGGNTLKLWYGKKLGRISGYYARRSEKLIVSGKKTIITNPSCKFANLFTLVINFTVNNSKKYQLITQGDYKEKYKEHSEKETEDSPLTTQEMFILIKEHQEDWYLKE